MGRRWLALFCQTLTTLHDNEKDIPEWDAFLLRARDGGDRIRDSSQTEVKSRSKVPYPRAVPKSVPISLVFIKKVPYTPVSI